MTFCWDENKRKANLDKHHLDFADAPRIFAAPLLTTFDDREDYGEDRWVGIGMLDGRVVSIVFCELGDTIRVITLRKASVREAGRYEREFRN